MRCDPTVSESVFKKNDKSESILQVGQFSEIKFAQQSNQMNGQKCQRPRVKGTISKENNFLNVFRKKNCTSCVLLRA